MHYVQARSESAGSPFYGVIEDCVTPAIDYQALTESLCCSGVIHCVVDTSCGGK